MPVYRTEDEYIEAINDKFNVLKAFDNYMDKFKFEIAKIKNLRKVRTYVPGVGLVSDEARAILNSRMAYAKNFDQDLARGRYISSVLRNSPWRPPRKIIGTTPG